MKKYCLYFTFFAFASCTNSDRVATVADTASKVAGIYKASIADISGHVVALPQNGVSMAVKLTRIDKGKADFLLTANVAGVIQQEGSPIALVRSGEKITMMKNETTVGYVDGKNIHLDFISDDGSRIILEASK